MKQLVVVVLVGSGCWSSTQPGSQSAAQPRAELAAQPASPPPAAPAQQVAEVPPPGEEEDDRDTTPQAGVLGSAALQQGGAFASLTGTGDLSSGMDDVYGGLDADATGGTGTGGMRGSPVSVPTTRFGEAAVTGTLDKAIIRRYVRRDLRKLQDCYEKQLLATPGIGGTVKAEFTIGADGKVSSASATGVHANVATCVAAAIKAIHFPRPNGGDVRVAYPFVFAPASDANAYGGLGLRGTGAGGGGTGYGTIGLGNYGTIGHGSGTGSGYGSGYGGIGLRRGGPTTQLGQPITRGPLDKAIIRRYVRRHLNKITYCYERQLLRSPKLAGTLTAKFVIETGGTVAVDRVKGLHADVDACVARVIEQIRFAKPSGGGTVTVSYPFTFAPGTAGSPGHGGTSKVMPGAERAADGTDDGSVDGAFGIGRSDPAAIGGGGTTGLGTIGHGSGAGSGYGIGSGRNGRGSRSSSTATPGEATTTGALDKDVIRRYVKRNVQKVRYCYEKQLLKTPKLAGTITAKFTIGLDGKVAISTATGLHPDVDACVARVLRGIEFPKPTGGGVVTVSYPFVFAPAPDDAKPAP